MKKIMIAVMAVATVGLVSWTSMDKSAEGVQTFKLDTAKTTLNWSGNYLADGHSHMGTVNVTEGAVMYKGKKFQSGAFVVDLSTIAVTDLPDEKKPMLVGHLKSPDFFNVEKFMKVPVKITGITATEIQATITVMGKEIAATMPVKVEKAADMITAKGKFDIDLATTGMNGFKAAEGKPANARVNSVVSFDINLVLKK